MRNDVLMYTAHKSPNPDLLTRFCLTQDCSGGDAQKMEPWVREFALRPQERAFKPGQLTQLVTFLAGGKLGGSWDPGGEGDMGEWLLRLFSSCPVLPNMANPMKRR